MLLRRMGAAICFTAALFTAGQAAGIPFVQPTESPRVISIALERGLELERDGNIASAERFLIEAARWDRQYQPAWTLANFYFRQGDTESFWKWAGRAAEMAYDNYRPLLRLACAIEDDPETIVARLGKRPKLVRALLDITIAEGRLDAAQQVGKMLAGFHDPADGPRLEALEERIRKDVRAKRMEAGR